MSTLSDAELLRIAGLRAEQAVRALPALRQSLVLLPNDPIHVTDSPDWPLFATAVTMALALSAAPTEHTGWLNRWHVIGVVMQIIGILRNRGENRLEFEWAINRASIRHWLDATGDHSEGDPELIRPTLLGERVVREKLNGAAAVEQAAGRTNGVERLKLFRTAFLRYVRDTENRDYQDQSPDPELFAVMQDAWIEVADVVYPPELYETDAIEAAVLNMWPDHRDVWRQAETQIGRLILSIGTDARLQRARAAALRADVDKLFPAQRPTVQAEPESVGRVVAAAVAAQHRPAKPADLPKSVEPRTPEPSSAKAPTGPIQYVTRERAAALCGRSKEWLANLLNNEKEAPDPVVSGGGGKAHEYDWAVLRPFCVRWSGRVNLPERLPTLDDDAGG